MAGNGDATVGVREVPLRTLLPPLVIALFLHAACIFTFTFLGMRPRWPQFIRFILGPLALWAFWDFGYGHFQRYDPLVSIRVCILELSVLSSRVLLSFFPARFTQE